MSRQRAWTGKELIAALLGRGFAVSRIRGSHHFLRHTDGRTTVIPAHAGEDLGRGLLAKILRDVKLGVEDLEESP